MSEKRREIYARMGVQLINNRRAQRAERRLPGSMGLYLFAMLYTRAELLDGLVPEDIMLTAWGAPEDVRSRQVDVLVDVDLLERVEGGFRVVKYEEHNDTAAEVEANRAKDRERKRPKGQTQSEFPPGIQPDSVRIPPGTHSDSERIHKDFPSSISCSFSESEERSEIRESSPRARDTRPDEVWEHYLSVRKVRRPNMRKATLDAKDRKAILEALKAYDVEALKLSCEGLFLSTHHLGQNDRGTEYLGIEYAVKPRNIEGFIAAAQDARPPPSVSRPMPVAEAYVSAEEIEAVLSATSRKLGAS